VDDYALEQFRMRIATFLIFLALTTSADAQMPLSAEAKQQQIDEVSKLDAMDGHWRGTAWIILPNGKREELVQTERVGPLLGGAIKVVEGRGYDDSDATKFNALGIIAYDSRKQRLMMRTYAQGNLGDFPIQLTKDGYTWEIPAGPATIRYTATVKDGTWVEFGERVLPDQAPRRFFEMKLLRLNDSEWPAAGTVPSKS
jgi:hypothetical protein